MSSAAATAETRSYRLAYISSTTGHLMAESIILPIDHLLKIKSSNFHRSDIEPAFHGLGLLQHPVGCTSKKGGLHVKPPYLLICTWGFVIPSFVFTHDSFIYIFSPIWVYIRRLSSSRFPISAPKQSSPFHYSTDHYTPGQKQRQHVHIASLGTKGPLLLLEFHSFNSFFSSPSLFFPCHSILFSGQKFFIDDSQYTYLRFPHLSLYCIPIYAVLGILNKKHHELIVSFRHSPNIIVLSLKKPVHPFYLQYKRNLLLLYPQSNFWLNHLLLESFSPTSHPPSILTTLHKTHIPIIIIIISTLRHKYHHQTHSSNSNNCTEVSSLISFYTHQKGLLFIETFKLYNSMLQKTLQKTRNISHKKRKKKKQNVLITTKKKKKKKKRGMLKKVDHWCMGFDLTTDKFSGIDSLVHARYFYANNVIKLSLLPSLISTSLKFSGCSASPKHEESQLLAIAHHPTKRHRLINIFFSFSFQFFFFYNHLCPPCLFFFFWTNNSNEGFTLCCITYKCCMQIKKSDPSLSTCKQDCVIFLSKQRKVSAMVMYTFSHLRCCLFLYQIRTYININICIYIYRPLFHLLFYLFFLYLQNKQTNKERICLEHNRQCRVFMFKKKTILCVFVFLDGCFFSLRNRYG
ncbi:hypothetical protein VP01_276g4 [Puccinia sorghi]|uniref:Uncharacterized protein n=1 Tax=Puccinia sorghi TaxID=27349 RepID=A0A0L6V2T5_9BASI|nr:hypothetical protein VP01_276g4 [Puccinia sorghi]